MSWADDILNAREERAFKINELINNTVNTYLIVKANIPGNEKNTLESMIIIDAFKNYIDLNYSYKKKEFVESIDGNYYLYTFDYDGIYIKKEMIKLEERHLLGRLVDLDVYQKEAISRSRLHLFERKCLLCDDIARVCIRLQKHSLNEIRDEIKKIVKIYVEIEGIVKIVTQSLIDEVNLHPKFGLVTSKHSGIHEDMSYVDFIVSAKTLEPYFIEMAMTAYLTSDYEILFNRLRKIGLRAEQHMFVNTNGVNTHKGAIFIFGLILGALFIEDEKSYKIKLSELSKFAFNDFEQMPESNGLKIFNKHQIMGVRGEMLNGMSSVFDHALPFYEALSLEADERLIATLMKLMSVVDDTVQIHKTSIEDFKSLQQDVAHILSLNHFFTKEGRKAYENLLEESIKRRISPGGCADLLAATIFFSKIKKESFSSLTNIT
jgi:holo-ACP synthase/triphosphoribosyl-dephospho-CoA synthase